MDLKILHLFAEQVADESPREAWGERFRIEFFFLPLVPIRSVNSDVLFFGLAAPAPSAAESRPLIRTRPPDAPADWSHRRAATENRRGFGAGIAGKDVPFFSRQSDGRGPRRHGRDAARVRVSAAKRPERGGARLLATASPEATAWRGGLEGEERLVHVESRNSIVSLTKLFEAFFSWFLTSTAHLSPGSPADAFRLTMPHSQASLRSGLRKVIDRKRDFLWLIENNPYLLGITHPKFLPPAPAGPLSSKNKSTSGVAAARPVRAAETSVAPTSLYVSTLRRAGQRK